MSNGIMDFFGQQQSPMSQMNLAKPATGQMMPMPQTQVGNAQQAPMTPSLATPQQEAQMQTPMGQQEMGALGGFDMKGMASALTKAAQGQQQKAQQMAQAQTNPGQPMDMQAYNAQLAGMRPQAGASKPMQMIQGFQNQGLIGGQPNMQQILQALQGR